MNRSPRKRLALVCYSVGVVLLYLLTPALLVFEWIYGGGPRTSAAAGLLSKGRPVIIGVFVALVLYDMTHAFLCRHS